MLDRDWGQPPANFATTWSASNREEDRELSTLASAHNLTANRKGSEICLATRRRAHPPAVDTRGSGAAWWIRQSQKEILKAGLIGEVLERSRESDRDQVPGRQEGVL